MRAVALLDLQWQLCNLCSLGPPAHPCLWLPFACSRNGLGTCSPLPWEAFVMRGEKLRFVLHADSGSGVISLSYFARVCGDFN